MATQSTALTREDRNRVHADERQSFSVETFALRNGISKRQAVYELASGRLVGRKCGKRTLITVEAEKAWQRALPKLIPSAAAAKAKGDPTRSAPARRRPGAD